MKKYFYIFIAIFFIVCSCSKSNVAGNDRLHIYVSIPVQKFFVNEICGDLAEVFVLVPPGKSPTTFEPTAKDITMLSISDMYFSIGVPFEKNFIPKIKSMIPKLEIVDLSSNLAKRMLESHNHEENDSENNSHIHEEETEDPHVWMSPTNVIFMGKSILETMITIDPKNKKVYDKNFELFCDKISSLSIYTNEKLGKFSGRHILVSHPAFGYFTDEFGLEQISVELNGKEPTPASLVELIQLSKSLNINTIFVQPEFSKKSATSIAEAINGKVVTLNPLSEDYITMIKETANEIAKSFEK